MSEPDAMKLLKECPKAIQKNQALILQKLAQPSSQPGPSSVPIPITLPVVLQCRLFPYHCRHTKVTTAHLVSTIRYQSFIIHSGLVRLLEREDSTMAEVSYCRSFPNLGMISERTELLYQIVAKIIQISFQEVA